MPPLLLLLVILSLLPPVVSAGNCTHFQNTCPEYTPCCNNGWCFTSSGYCAVGCQPINSYSFVDSCFPKLYSDTDLDYDFSSSGNGGSGSGGSKRVEIGIPKVIERRELKSVGDMHRYKEYFILDSGSTTTTSPAPSTSSTPPTIQLSLSKQNSHLTTTRLTSILSIRNSRVSTTFKPCLRVGVVSSFIVLAENGDELDFEYVGRNSSTIQSNWYYRGRLEYGNVVYHALPGGSSGTQGGGGGEGEGIVLSIEYTPSYIKWLINHSPVRTEYHTNNNNPNSQSKELPTTPGQVMFSIWDTSQSEEGTKEWAGVFEVPPEDGLVCEMSVGGIIIESLVSGGMSDRVGGVSKVLWLIFVVVVVMI